VKDNDSSLSEKKPEDKYIAGDCSVRTYGYFSAVWPLKAPEKQQEANEEKESGDETDDLFGEMESEINEEMNNENAEAQKDFSKALKDFETGKASSIAPGIIYFKCISKY
jgi:hypothetical protein